MSNTYGTVSLTILVVISLLLILVAVLQRVNYIREWCCPSGRKNTKIEDVQKDVWHIGEPQPIPQNIKTPEMNFFGDIPTSAVPGNKKIAELQILRIVVTES